MREARALRDRVERDVERALTRHLHRGVPIELAVGALSRVWCNLLRHTGLSELQISNTLIALANEVREHATK